MEDDELRDGSVSEQEVCFLQDVARVKTALQRLHTKLGRPGVEEMSQVLKRGGSSSCQLRRHDECIVAPVLKTCNSNSRGQQLVDKCWTLIIASVWTSWVCIARRNPLYDKASVKRLNSQTNTPVSVNSTSHQTRTTRTFFSWALRMTQVISLVHNTVILGPRCHVTPWYWWACFLVFPLHISFLFVFLFIRSRIESKSHCRSTQRRVWLNDWISNTDYQFNIGLTRRIPRRSSIRWTITRKEYHWMFQCRSHIKNPEAAAASQQLTQLRRCLIPTESAFVNENETMFLKQVCFLIQ